MTYREEECRVCGEQYHDEYIKDYMTEYNSGTGDSPDISWRCFNHAAGDYRLRVNEGARRATPGTDAFFHYFILEAWHEVEGWEYMANFPHTVAIAEVHRYAVGRGYMLRKGVASCS